MVARYHLARPAGLAFIEQGEVFNNIQKKKNRAPQVFGWDDG
jgi:hypothetical protein